MFRVIACAVLLASCVGPYDTNNPSDSDDVENYHTGSYYWSGHDGVRVTEGPEPVIFLDSGASTSLFGAEYFSEVMIWNNSNSCDGNPDWLSGLSRIMDAYYLRIMTPNSTLSLVSIPPLFSTYDSQYVTSFGVGSYSNGSSCYILTGCPDDFPGFDECLCNPAGGYFGCFPVQYFVDNNSNISNTKWHRFDELHHDDLPWQWNHSPFYRVPF